MEHCEAVGKFIRKEREIINTVIKRENEKGYSDHWRSVSQLMPVFTQASQVK